ncbi:sulfurtransferase [Mycolicibacterium sp. S2-37]|uniref:sulfurtransferase n=1 Tax=Mycolicibacterium sp. S2-37 TaxID=2810297 RepID=UPI001A950BE9|nr:sulfurtransferase [Mycolicibacterium sp. S2-37]MBO0680821.1 sulfurtransferase [Mycolicibacterium sp. S2-37]
MTRAGIFITAAELKRLLDGGGPVAVLDVRWQLNEPDGHDAYRRGHVPGAVYVSLDDELTDHSVTGRGRHPLPTGSSVQAAARLWGVRDGVPTVVYDDWNRAGSARAWWVLTAAGISDVRILDGGLAAWTAAGGRLEAGEVTPEPGDVVVTHEDLYHGALPTLTAEEVAGYGGLLLDARAPRRFSGEDEPVDPVAGHIAGARNAPSTDVLTADGTLRPADDLTRFFDDRGVAGDVGVYCGSGVTASVVVAVLRDKGIDAALYPGSWSEWCSDPSRPVATGS